MAQEVENVRFSGLATIAFLKAQIDAGSDNLGMFMPLVIDVVQKLDGRFFIPGAVKDALKTTHGIVIPLNTVTTLLRRGVSQNHFERAPGSSGGYKKRDSVPLPATSVASEKASIEAEQSRLAAHLQAHAAKRDVALPSTEVALDKLIEFIEREHVDLLLHQTAPNGRSTSADNHLDGVMAEFITGVVASDPALSSAMNRILEGLVLYHAAFNPSTNPASRAFKDLTVVFDSSLVLQALGYEGAASQQLMRETIDILKSAKAECIVFDKTTDEIHRILSMYRTKLASSGGRASLHPSPMARHLLTHKTSPGDVAQMAAQLEANIKSAGLRLQRLPTRDPKYTADEAKLSRRLVNQQNQDEQEPRVLHDVDCVAGVLVLRKGHRSTLIDEVRAVFATTSRLVIENTLAWWNADERESCIEPVVHVRALANIAWLKRPKLSSDFKLRELVALCAASMRPGQVTWDRFLRHLKALQEDKRLTSDEAAALVASAMSDKLLREAELKLDDQVDAATLDEVVERVMDSFHDEWKKEREQLSAEHAREREKLEEEARDARERAEAAEKLAEDFQRKNESRVEAQIRFLARWTRFIVCWPLFVIAPAGGILLVYLHYLSEGSRDLWLLALLACFVVLEVVGLLLHLLHFGGKVEAWASGFFRKLLLRDPSQRARQSPWDP